MEGEQLYWQTVELYSNPTFMLLSRVVESLGAVGAPLTWDPNAPADLGQGADAALTWQLGVDIMPLKCVPWSRAFSVRFCSTGSQIVTPELKKRRYACISCDLVVKL